MKIKLLYPSDYYDNKTVDTDYENEYREASKFRELDIIFYNYDEFLTGSCRNN